MYLILFILLSWHIQQKWGFMSISGDIYRIYPISDIMTLNPSIQIQELIYIYISYNNTLSYIYIILDILQLLQ